MGGVSAFLSTLRFGRKTFRRDMPAPTSGARRANAVESPRTDKKKKPDRLAFLFAAGARHVLPGKIQFLPILSEICTSEWETSSFSYKKNKSSCPIRILESPASDLFDSDIRKFLSEISFINEIFLGEWNY
jgi:hypothetical protein